MNKWSERYNSGNNPIRGADRKSDLKMKSNVWDLWDNIKHANLLIIRTPRRLREKEIKNVFEETMAENSPKLKKVET